MPTSRWPATEQATGIDQINTALVQMDEVTQQNSALVEENAATAKTLEQQSGAMNSSVGTFKLADAESAHVPSAPVVAMKRAPSEPAREKAAPAKQAAAPARRGRTQGALALKNDADWKEF